MDFPGEITEASGPSSYGHPPGRDEIKALVESGLTDAQIADRFNRSRAWAKSLRRRYQIAGHSKGIGMRRRAAAGSPGTAFGIRLGHRSQRRPARPVDASAPVLLAEPSRPPSLDGLDEECRRWLERGGHITRIELVPWPAGPMPAHPRRGAGGVSSPA